VTEGLDQPKTPEGPQGGSAGLSARSISRAEGVSAFQALQRVLYRSAKQDPERRFHALYDKLTRRDVMWRAWVSVAQPRRPRSRRRDNRVDRGRRCRDGKGLPR